MCVSNNENDSIMIITSNGYGKRTSVESFKSKGRNGKGVKFMNLTGKNGIPVSLKLVSGDDDLIVITDKGMVVRTHLDQILTIGRDTQGVKVVSLYDSHTVASIAIVPRGDDEEEVDEEIDDINFDDEYESEPKVNFVQEEIEETEEESDFDDEYDDI